MVDIGCSLEDLPGIMCDRTYGERKLVYYVLSARVDAADHDDNLEYNLEVHLENMLNLISLPTQLVTDDT